MLFPPSGEEGRRLLYICRISCPLDSLVMVSVEFSVPWFGGDDGLPRHPW